MIEYAVAIFSVAVDRKICKALIQYYETNLGFIKMLVNHLNRHVIPDSKSVKPNIVFSINKDDINENRLTTSIA